KSGNYHLVGVPRDIILVAEGYATAASLFEATGIATAVAFDAGNLAPVCKNLRRRYKRARLLICADDDTWTDGNPGVTKAKLAALECGGEVLIPQWPDPDERERALERGEKWTDFNDLANSPAGGLPLVRIQVEDRLRELGWQEPRARAPATTPRGGGGDGGGRPGLQPIDDLEELLDRFVMIYAAGGQVFDRQEHIMLKLTDMKDLCRRRELYNEWLAHPRREVVRLDE